MTTEVYLSQIKKLEYMIEDKLNEINRLRTICENISVATDRENVQTSKSNDKLLDAIAKIVDLERETDELVDKLVDKRKKIISQIDAMDNVRYYRYLTYKYVGGRKVKEIADEMKYSLAGAKKIHKNAINSFEKIYGNEYLHK